MKIEDKQLDSTSVDSLFLLFLRTCCFEIAQKRDSEIFLKEFYEFSKEFLHPELRQSLEAELAKDGLVRHSAYLLEQLFEIYRQEDWGKVSHKVATLENCIGLSSASTISIRDGDIREWDRDAEKPLPFVAFNVVPSKDSTLLVLSWFAEWSSLVEDFWSRYKTAPLSSVIYDLAVCRSEDTFFSPAVWERFSASEREAIVHSFRSMEINDNVTDEHPLRDLEISGDWTSVVEEFVCQ